MNTASAPVIQRPTCILAPDRPGRSAGFPLVAGKVPQVRSRKPFRSNSLRNVRRGSMPHWRVGRHHCGCEHSERGPAQPWASGARQRACDRRLMELPGSGPGPRGLEILSRCVSLFCPLDSLEQNRNNVRLSFLQGEILHVPRRCRRSCRVGVDFAVHWHDRRVGAGIFGALAACRTYSREGRILKQTESPGVERRTLCTLRGQFGFHCFAGPLSPTGS
jgi:hypothetical protein